MKRSLLTISIVGLLMFAGLTAVIYNMTRDTGPETESISVANQLYVAGRYHEAAQVYEQLISQGVVSSTLYYNLGNTYLVQGDHGRAILNYQRAARLNPRDPDIKANLAIVRAQSGSDFTPGTVNPIQSLSNFSSSWMTLDEMGLATMVIWFILGFLVFSYRQLRQNKLRVFLRYGIVLAILVFLTAGLSLGSRLYVERTTPEAVILDEVVTLNSDPGEEYPTEFQLISGTEVKILGTRGSWAHLSGYNEAIEGWIPLSSLETVSWRINPEETTF